jgi:NADPH-dependent curcumin reductase CurA
MEGFIVFDFVKEYPAARKQLAQWLAEGKLKRQETVVKGGLKVAEQALVDLFKGKNTGKNVTLLEFSFQKLTSVGKLLVEVKAPEEKSKL